MAKEKQIRICDGCPNRATTSRGLTLSELEVDDHRVAFCMKDGKIHVATNKWMASNCRRQSARY